MNPAVIDLIIKGVESLPALVDAGVSIYNRVQTIKGLAEGAKAGTPITPAEIAKIHAQFDADWDEFDKPIP
jgi:hypothetical protein